MNNPFTDPIKITKAEKAKFEELAHSWNTLQNVISSLDEETLVKLYHWERDGHNRIHLLNRLKSKHNRVRDTRERREVLDDA